MYIINVRTNLRTDVIHGNKTKKGPEALYLRAFFAFMGLFD
jgi:hypothetical protein